MDQFFAGYPSFGGGGGGGVTTLNGMSGALTLVAGSGITITPGSGTLTIASTGGGSGTVTSVGLALPASVFSISGSPVTTSGTLSGAFISQLANTVFAAPNGAPGTPSFRSLLAADLPNTAVTPGSYTSTNLTVDAQGRITAASNGSGGSGTVTSVGSGTGLTGGPITTSGTLSLANTAVSPGSYTSANITVDAQGRITAAANGSGGISTIGAFDGQPASADGLSISGSSLYAQSASATEPGMVNLTAQTFLGNKTIIGVGAGEADALILTSGANTTLRIQNTGAGTAGLFIGNAGGATADYQINNLDGGTLLIESPGGITFTSSAFTFNTAINMTGNLINNVTDPVSAQDAATKAYVDAAVGGGGANTSLSNLVSTAINTDLIPNTNGIRTLGSPGFEWSNLQSNSVTSASTLSLVGGNGVSITSAGSPALLTASALNLQAASGTTALAFYNSAHTNFVSFQADPALAADTAFVLPSADGASGDVLTTDGAGNLSFAPATISPTWVTYTPTVIQGYDTLTSAQAQYLKIGSLLIIQGSFVTGTGDANDVHVSIPFTANANNASTTIVGGYTNTAFGTNAVDQVVLSFPGQNFIGFGYQGLGASSVTPSSGSNLGGGGSITFYATIAL